VTDSGDLIQFLLVQDDPVDEVLLRHDLETNKFVNQVDILHDVPTTLAYLGGTPPFTRPRVPDVVLLDPHLSGRGGRAVLQHLRSTTTTATVPVVLLVDSPIAEAILRAEGLPVQSYAVKPVDFACLTAVVKNLDGLAFEIGRRS
jgi:DNA-binding response OmpR family regulator